SQDGKGHPQQHTSRADTYYYEPVSSPDSKKLLWADRLQRLRYVDVTLKTVTQVDQHKWGEIQSYDWSPDSQWIAWARPEENDLPRVYIYSLADKKQTAVTDEWYGSGNVAFSDDGKYLLFASGRDFKPTFAEDEFENVYLDMQRVYLVTLAKDTEPPLAPRSDEVGKAEQSGPDRKAHICSYSLEDRKEIVLGEVNAYQISADGKRMLVKIKKDYAIIDLPKDKLETKDHELKLAGLDMQLDKHAEWNQI